MGRPTAIYEATPSSAGWYHVSQVYTLTGGTQSVTIPGVPGITYAFDVEGRPDSVTATSGQNPLTSAAYDSWGHVTGLTFGSGDSDAYSFDPKTGRMLMYSLGVNGQSVSGTLSWNSNGSLASLDITDPFSAGDTQNCSFSHDDLGRISAANCGGEWAQTFSSDPFGNVSVPAGGNDPFPATFANNRISGVSGFAPNYDADGNLLDNPISQTRNAYAWDAEGRPIGVDGATQVFDAMGRVVQSSENSTAFVWSPGGRKIALMSGQGLAFSWVPLPGGAAAMYNASGLWYYGHADWLGSWRLASSPSRTFIGGLAYSPFGAAYAGSGPDNFTGAIADTPDNLNDFTYRLLQPAMARWLSPDPAGLGAVNPADPQSWNRYAYVENEPLSSVDPLGLFAPGPGPDPFTTDPFFFCGLDGLCGDGFGFAPFAPPDLPGAPGGGVSSKGPPSAKKAQPPQPPTPKQRYDACLAKLQPLLKLADSFGFWGLGSALISTGQTLVTSGLQQTLSRTAANLSETIATQTPTPGAGSVLLDWKESSLFWKGTLGTLGKATLWLGASATAVSGGARAYCAAEAGTL